ncbi:MAG: restriction endonuclease subunit S domain-containing protein, partial [Chloroflexota bacterium]
QNHVFRVRVNGKLILPRFFHEYLQSTQAKTYFLRCSKRTTNLASINMTQLRALPVPLADMNDQREFVARAKAIEKLRVAQRRSQVAADSLFASLQHRAFRGEL